MRLSFEQKHALGFGLIAVILILLGTISYRITVDAVEADRRVAQSHEILAGVEELQSLLKEAELRQRDYIVTGDATILDVFSRKVVSFDTEMARVRRLTTKNSRQQQRLHDLTILSHRRVAYLQEGIRLRNVEGFVPAMKHVGAPEGRSSMVQAERIVKHLKEEEKSRMLQLRETAEVQTKRAVAVSAIGIPIGFVLIALVYRLTRHELSERQRMEAALMQARDAALQSARLKAEFLANVSHEIRTPLNGIIGMSGLLLDTKLSKEQREYAGIVRSSADALLAIINDILDFSKVEAGRITLENLDFDLREVVESVAELMAGLAHAKKLELVARIEPDTPALLVGDPGRVRQVLTNLVNNAIKFTGNGRVVIRVAKESATESEAVLRFEVSDTGIGVPEEAQERIFHAFAQADSSTTRKYGGTGLGLTISRKLVTLLQGEIGVDSEPGEGSTFWFTARFQTPHGSQPRPVTPPKNIPRRALVVDDLEDGREWLVQLLESWGVETHAVAGGSEALVLIRRLAAEGASCDVVFLDAEMPGMGGLDLARAIRAESGAVATKFVLMRALGSTVDAAAMRDAGVRFQLLKPVRQSQLFDLLAAMAEAVPSDAKPETYYEPVEVAGVSLMEPAASHHLRILVADDSTANQKVALLMLRKLGFGADAVASGVEVLESLERIPYDLVLMDCQMPEMDGYEATAEIRRREGAAKRTAVVAMTAHGMKGDREKCLAAGMDDYISKPIQEHELARAITRWGSGKAARVEETS